jgi:protein ImuB
MEVILTRLLERVACRLADCDEGVVQLECRLTCSQQPLRISIGLFEPTARVSHLLELIRMQLDRLRLPQPVQAVAVHATATAKLCQRQGDLFADQSQRHPRQLATLVNRLSSRLGRRSVFRPQLVEDPQPERSWRYVPLAGRRASRSHPPRSNTGHRSKRTSRPARNPSPALSRKAPAATRSRTAKAKELTAASRPLRLHRSPLPLEVIAVVPDGPPVRFVLEDQQYRIARHWGPERIETGWWRGRSIRRDYYRVETDRGHRFWLFRRLDDGQWFLHGDFE